MVRDKKLTAREAADKIATIIETHLESLPGPERAARLRAFHKAASNALGTRAKRVRRSKTRQTRLLTLRSE